MLKVQNILVGKVNSKPEGCCKNVYTSYYYYKRRGFVIQCHNELRDLKTDPLSMVCSDVEVEPVLQDISGEQLSRGSNKAQDARLDNNARGFWGPQCSTFFI